MMNTTKIVLAAGTAMAVSSMASAQHLATFNNVLSDVPGDTRTTAAGAFTVGSLSWTGSVNAAGSGSWLSELTINATSPTSGPVSIQAGATGGSWSGPRTVSGWAAAFGGEAAAGTWSFEFTESFDDAAAPDATWSTANIFIDNSVLPSFAAPQAVGTTVDYAQGAGELIWVTFNHTGGPLSLTTAGSTNTGGTFGANDTEIGLYDSAGLLVGTNDDEDFGNNILTSRLDFANLPAGTYGVAMGGFNVSYADGFVVTDHTASGTTRLEIIPTPGTAALFGIAGLAGIRRRR